jgi:glycosyltransferase involved in cell wall biosynthesis
MNTEPRLRIGFISTSNYALNFFLKSYIRVVAKDADVVLISNNEHGVPEPEQGITFIEMPFKRRPSPHHDLLHLFQLTKIIRKQRLDAVYTISPKGGFLGMLAATLARIPTRVHFFTGQVWVMRTGFWRVLLKGLDQVIGRLSSFALVDSTSQRDFLIEERVVRAEKSTVLGAGSVAGVDIHRFSPNRAVRDEVRAEMGIPDDMPVVLFLGRLTRDKGVADLVQAFTVLAERYLNLGLVMAGPDEGELENLQEMLVGKKGQERVWFPGGTRQPERYFAAADVFCLPSYREGFGIVILEAAATGLPTVGSDIYGVRDAIVDGETGVLHRPADSKDIERALTRLIDDPTLRKKYGEAALKRARSVFSQDVMIDHFSAFHASINKPKGQK